MIPVPLPSPVLCHVHVRNPVTNTEDRRAMWVAAFTDVDPLGEQPGEDGDGVPLMVTDTGLRTPQQHAAEIGHVLLSWSLAWPQQQAFFAGRHVGDRPCLPHINVRGAARAYSTDYRNRHIGPMDLIDYGNADDEAEAEAERAEAEAQYRHDRWADETFG